MKLAGIAFTDRGSRLLKRLLSRFQEEGEETEGTVSPSCAEGAGGFSIRKETLKEWTNRQFQQADGLIFIGAAGIAVRACAPFVQDKTKDPAVIVIDETGRYAVSLLSGHLGGANELALRAAAFIGAEPVITTATDRNGLLAPDVFAKENGLEIEDMGLAREAAAALLRGEQIGFFSDFPVKGSLPEQLVSGTACRLNLWAVRAGDIRNSPAEPEEKKTERAGSRPEPEARESSPRYLKLLARDAVLGIGCRKGTKREAIEAMAESVLASQGLTMRDVRQIATIDLKQDETGLLEFAAAHRKRLCFYSPEELLKVPGDFSDSAFVKKTTGVGNVCERAAVLAAGEGGELAVKKHADKGVTAALAVCRRVIRMEYQRKIQP